MIVRKEDSFKISVEDGKCCINTGTISKDETIWLSVRLPIKKDVYFTMDLGREELISFSKMLNEVVKFL